MGVKSTVHINRADAERRVYELLDEKKQRIAESGIELRTALLLTGITPRPGSVQKPMFHSWLTEEQFIALRNNLGQLTNYEIEELLEMLVESELDNFSVTPG